MNPSRLRTGPAQRAPVPAPEHSAPAIPDHELIRRVGEGSYGEVWLARSVLGTRRAVKVVYRDRFKDDRPYEREFNGIQKFEPVSRTHEGLVDVLQIGRNEEAGYFYYVMELADDANAEGAPRSAEGAPRSAEGTPRGAEGSASDWPEGRKEAGGAEPPGLSDPSGHYTPKTLGVVLQRRGRLPFDECLALGLSLTTALHHLHRAGLVHRDIKPSNIIFVHGQPKLADIGLVAEVGEARSFVGTEGFIPPEGPGTPSADIYSLGKVLYEIATGKDRQSFPEPPTQVGELSDRAQLLELNEVILKACECDVGQRYSNGQEMLADLAMLQGGKSIRRFHQVERRLRWMTRAGLAALLVMVLGVIPYRIAIREALRSKALAKSESTQRQRADREAERARLLAYASDMNLVHLALRQDNLGRARELLERHRPQSGQAEARGWEWRYLSQIARGEAAFELCVRPNPIKSLAVSHDGHWLAVGERGRSEVSLWNLRTRQRALSLPAGEELGQRVAFAPHALLLAFAFAVEGARDGSKGGIRLWDVERQQTVRDLPLDDCCSGVSFSRDGKSLAGFPTRTGSPFVRWRVADGTPISTGPMPGTYEDYVVAAADDLAFAVHAQAGGAIRAIDLNTGEERWRIDTPDDYVTALAVSPDGKMFASGSGYAVSVIRLREAATGRELARLEGHHGFIAALAFGPDGATLVSASGDQTIRWWDLQTPGQPRLSRLMRGHEREVWALALSTPTPVSTLISGSNDGSVLLWDTAQSQDRRAEFVLPAAVAAWKFAADSQSVLTVDRPGRVHRWHGPAFAAVEPILEIGPGWVAPGFSEDARWLAAGTADGWVEVWDLARKRSSGRFRAAQSQVAPVRFLAGPNRLIVIEDTHPFPEQATVQEWDWLQPRSIRSWQSAGGRHGVAISPNERWQTGLSYGGGATWRSLPALLEAAPAPGCRGVAAAEFSPDGKLLAAASYLGFVRLWDAETRQEIGTLRGFLQGCVSVAFSPDGRRLAAGSDGREAVKLWDTQSLQEVMTLEAPGSSYALTAFSPDGNILGSSTRQGALHLWRAPSWSEIEARNANPARATPEPEAALTTRPARPR